MPIVAVVNTKGGSGKTTSAFFLAYAAKQQNYEVRVLDADPQGTATDWYYSLIESGADAPFKVDSANAATMRRVGHVGGDEWLFIDTPPGDSQAIKTAIEIADFVVVPTSPKTADMWRTAPTVEALENRLYAVLITQGRTGTKGLEETIAQLESEEISYFDDYIPLREAIASAVGDNPTDLYGYDKIFTEIRKAI